MKKYIYIGIYDIFEEVVYVYDEVVYWKCGVIVFLNFFEVFYENLKVK